MISPRKFLTLDDEHQLRKLRKILLELRSAARGAGLDGVYARQASVVLEAGRAGAPGAIADLDEILAACLRALQTPHESGARVSRLCHQGVLSLEAALGVPLGEWDLDSPDTIGADADPVPDPRYYPGHTRVGPETRSPGETGQPISTSEGNAGSREPEIQVYLEDLRSPFNVGSIFRTCDAMGVSRVLLSPRCPQPGTKRVDRSSMGSVDWIPWRVLAPEDIPSYCRDEELSVLVLETGGTDYTRTVLPPRCLVILGSEELGVSPGCAALGPVVSIGMSGRKGSLNVGVSFGIVASRWRECRS
ncbi:TrmH family RNA methyltransferase [Spirochaeta lutea]|uniref:TrmH family RNA methyltransferase n=1 Tax=Spirochaeta lutea TaxID=1480694 RepID=UPI00068F2ECC|nr:TrmH family RNA methyltransferase [Spirochaeta lutea]